MVLVKKNEFIQKDLDSWLDINHITYMRCVIYLNTGVVC